MAIYWAKRQWEPTRIQTAVSDALLWTQYCCVVQGPSAPALFWMPPQLCSLEAALCCIRLSRWLMHAQVGASLPYKVCRFLFLSLNPEYTPCASGGYIISMSFPFALVSFSLGHCELKPKSLYVASKCSATEVCPQARGTLRLIFEGVCVCIWCVLCFMCIWCVCGCNRAHATVCMWRSEDRFENYIIKIV